jgi:peptidoglycan-associated lipoprotein
MKEQLRRSLAICAVAAICCAGCAKQQVVKQDQMIPPATSAASAQPAKPVAAVQPVTETKLPAAGIKETQPESQTQAQDAPQGKDAALKAGLDKVFFDFDAHTLSPAARETLAKNAEVLKKQKGGKVQIEGHCDELGSDEYNLALGEKRAKAAQQYLVGMGIQPSRLSTISYGKEKPADPGHDEAARAKNRRDEFVIGSN